METFQVIFNDVPLSKSNLFWEKVYLPKQVIIQAESYRGLLEKVDAYILKTGIEFSSYEINLVR